MTGIDIILFSIYLISLGGIWYYLQGITEKISKENTQLLISNHDMARRLELLDVFTDELEELMEGTHEGTTLKYTAVIEELRSITK